MGYSNQVHKAVLCRKDEMRGDEVKRKGSLP